jgi:hypothetical protein
MTRDDIIRMARQTDLHERVKDGVGYVVRIPNLEKLERFAALVAAHEREACAKVCEADSLSWGQKYALWGKKYAAAIRARGEV